jgi:hypothetical protein
MDAVQAKRSIGKAICRCAACRRQPLRSPSRGMGKIDQWSFSPREGSSPPRGELQGGKASAAVEVGRSVPPGHAERLIAWLVAQAWLGDGGGDQLHGRFEKAPAAAPSSRWMRRRRIRRLIVDPCPSQGGAVRPSSVQGFAEMTGCSERNQIHLLPKPGQLFWFQP